MENTFLYFAYGSNLNKALMEFRVNDTVTVLEPAILYGYGLAFHQLNADGSARANLVISESENVHGVLYQVHHQHFELLQQTEPQYQLQEFELEGRTGLHQAYAFICVDETEELSPESEYLNTLLEGATQHQLPENYIAYIKHKANFRTEV